MAAARHNLTRRAVLGAGAALAAAAVTGASSAAVASAPAAAPGSRARRTSAIDIFCGKCGSRDVSRDAWANWDTDEQAWVLGPVFDYGHCHVCDDEVWLEEVELSIQPSRTG